VPAERLPADTDGAFARALVRWHVEHGRHDLPWQGTRDPYRVWLSEIMLQQTQVATVLGYYDRFLRRFPDLRALAAAPLDEVLPLWAGLGYYARARLAHACARQLVAQHGARFPRAAAELERLPGVGTSTAAAIAALCFGERAAILDANVKRVLARRYAVDGDPRRPAVSRQLWQRARALLPVADHMGVYTQAIMDLGAAICTRVRPRCPQCPVRSGCMALDQGRTEELPTRVVRAPRPVRTTHMLIAIHRRAVLLERRPPAGIWGGLLGAPQFDSPGQLHEAARALGALAPARALAERRHGFTHFTLAYTPHLLALGGRRPRAPERRHCWLPLARIEEQALPAPLLALLRALRDQATLGSL
jgi:A/G-specific adenine glycosylase